MVNREAERRAKVDELHQRLVDEVRQLRTGKAWKAWLDAATRFHDYSFRNVVLIAMQCPGATRVAGFHTWKRLGRHVNRHEKGIQILAPIYRKPRSGELNEPATEEAASRRLVGYRVTSVFDISQTSGDPLPALPKPGLIRGRAPAGLWDALAAEVTRAGFTLNREAISAAGAKGFTTYLDRRVVVAAELDEATAVAVLAHEVAHMTMHLPDPQAASEIAKCRGIREVEAESVAYMLLSHHGLRTDEASFAYVAGWAASLSRTEPEAEVQKVGNYVVNVARTLIDRTDAHLGHHASRPTRDKLLTTSTTLDKADIGLDPR
ncbi:ArdC-like ssDNA-binding domain-containing protein [Kribbella deserti]|uniref:ArdC-like ssDNA-binding domain-containing protein n=1 Tax=Kribbella deserti TaxID=1926257 RepID=A0ABV6QEH9_9ACTN